MKALLLMAILALLVWFWQHSLSIRERATFCCRRICREMNLQFLDQTVALAFLVPDISNGILRFRRRYNFEFSIDGNDRHRGYVILDGATVRQVGIGHPDGEILVNYPQRQQLR